VTTAPNLHGASAPPGPMCDALCVFSGSWGCVCKDPRVAFTVPDCPDDQCVVHGNERKGPCDTFETVACPMSNGRCVVENDRCKPPCDIFSKSACPIERCFAHDNTCKDPCDGFTISDCPTSNGQCIVEGGACKPL